MHKIFSQKIRNIKNKNIRKTQIDCSGISRGWGWTLVFSSCHKKFGLTSNIEKKSLKHKDISIKPEDYDVFHRNNSEYWLHNWI